MLYVLRLAVNDFKNIIRDKFLVYAALVVPLLLIVFSRLIVHIISDYYPLEKQYSLIFMMFSIFIPMIYGFITAFLIIDERDENLLTILRVMPISRNTYLIYRMFFMTIFSFIFILIYPPLSGLVETSTFNYISYIPIAALYSLFTPFSALLTSSFANNKVQAFAIFKMGGTLFIIPLFGFFLLDNMKYVFGVIPNFWTFNAVNILITENKIDIPSLAIGYIFHIGLIAYLFYKFNKKY